MNFLKTINLTQIGDIDMNKLLEVYFHPWFNSFNMDYPYHTIASLMIKKLVKDKIAFDGYNNEDPYLIYFYTFRLFEHLYYFLGWSFDYMIYKMNSLFHTSFMDYINTSEGFNFVNKLKYNSQFPKLSGF